MPVLVKRKIPYVNLAAQHAPIKAELLSAVESIIDKGNFILGEEVTQFEGAFAELCKTEYAVAVNSGTDALILALRVAGIGPGDEVITQANSFVASTSAIQLVDAKTVFADVTSDYSIDVAEIKKLISKKTKAILPVHLTGRPADMDEIMNLAGEYGLIVIEDCAQAICAEFDGQPVGSFGKLGCFSLHPLKTLNALGDGGVITTNDSQLADRLKVLRNIGLATRENCTVFSGNSRLDTIQAAMLLVKLKYLQAWTEKRRENAQLYRELLADVPQVIVPTDDLKKKSVYHTFVVLAQQRDALRKFLAEADVGTAIHYPMPIHLQTAAAELNYSQGDLPVTEEQASKILSLPIYPELQNEDIEHVIACIKEFYDHN